MMQMDMDGETSRGYREHWQTYAANLSHREKEEIAEAYLRHVYDVDPPVVDMFRSTDPPVETGERMDAAPREPDLTRFWEHVRHITGDTTVYTEKTVAWLAEHGGVAAAHQLMDILQDAPSPTVKKIGVAAHPPVNTCTPV